MAGSDTENMENPENSQSTPLPDIQELTYYVHGTMMELIRSVSLIRQGGESAGTDRALALYHLNQPYITVYHKITDY